MSKRPGDPGYAARWCIHYRSPQDAETCEAGVPYSRFRPPHGVWSRQPCFLDDKGESKPDAVSCEKLRRPTPEEIALHEGWLRERLEKIGKAMQAILPFRERVKREGRGFSGEIECPVCAGRLRFSIAGSNGHAHVHCSTEGCVSWME